MKPLVVGAVLSAFVLGGILGAGIYSVTAEPTRQETGREICDGKIQMAMSDDNWTPEEKEKFFAQFTPDYCAKLMTCHQAGNTERCPRPLDY